MFCRCNENTSWKHRNRKDIIIIIKTSGTSPSGKVKLFINYFHNPTSTSAMKN